MNKLILAMAIKRMIIILVMILFIMHIVIIILGVTFMVCNASGDPEWPQGRSLLVR